MDRVRLRQKAGFTLIELVIVMVVISIALAIVLPRFTSLNSQNLKSDAEKVSALVRYLHEAAESRKLFYRLSFDTEKGTVTVERSKDSIKYSRETEASVRGFSLASGVEILDIQAPGLGSVASGRIEVLFAPVGSSPFTLHLGGSDNVLTVSFNPYNGRVSVEEGYK